MRIGKLIYIARFWRHLHYHKQIIKHLRWTKADADRIAFYRALISPVGLVFDVGANMGNRSKIFRELGTRVIAFELQSYCAKFLAVAFSGDQDFTLTRMALSDKEGDMEMHLGEAHTLSTLDTDWISKMKNGGRFSSHNWNETETVQVTTLDKAIVKYGLPEFIKVDVEGHELGVLRGLSIPVDLLSLEFASESLDSAYKCIDHLEKLANYEYRISLGESMQFEESAWTDNLAIKNLLEMSRERDPLMWGDIYARKVSN